MTDILMPNLNIEEGYEEYLAQTSDGRLITGIIAKQSPTAVTLRRAKGEEDTILRSNLTSLRSLSLSPMPEDLEKSISAEGMADLLPQVGQVRGRPGEPGHDALCVIGACIGLLEVDSWGVRNVWHEGITSSGRADNSWLGEPLDEAGNEAVHFRGRGGGSQQESEDEAEDRLPDPQAHIAPREIDADADECDKRN